MVYLTRYFSFPLGVFLLAKNLSLLVKLHHVVLLGLFVHLFDEVGLVLVGAWHEVLYYEEVISGDFFRLRFLLENKLLLLLT